MPFPLAREPHARARTTRLVSRVAALGTALVLLAGCSRGSGEGGPVTITLTPSSIAAISMEVLGESSARSYPWTVEDGVGAELAYNGAANYVGDRVRIGIRPSADGELESDLCRELADEITGCEQTSNEKLMRLWVTWRTETPGGDPGIVTVTRVKGGETAFIELVGPVITGDPRTLLDGDRFSVPSLQAVLEDSRMDLKTSEAAIALGKRVKGWSDQTPGSVTGATIAPTGSATTTP